MAKTEKEKLYFGIALGLVAVATAPVWLPVVKAGVVLAAAEYAFEAATECS